MSATTVFTKKEAVPDFFLMAEPLIQDTYLCNGTMQQWDGPVHDVYSPVHFVNDTGTKPVFVGSYPLCTAAEAMLALTAATTAYNNGQGEWPAMSVMRRIKCVEQFTKKMIEQKALVVKLLMWEIGKSYSDAEKEFDRTVEYIYATIDALKDLDRASSKFEIEQGILAQVRPAPLGVVLCMGPFNYPLNETLTSLIPALLMGNTILFKPPKHGTLLHYPLLQAFCDCFPKGVVNTIYGRGHTIVPVLMQSGKINVLTLIGSSKVANELKKMHPKVNQLRAILGLDAKNAAIITAHADVELAVKEAVAGSLAFNGQRCTALKILFVHQSIADTFIAAFNQQINKLKIGMPWEEGVHITPLPEPGKPDYLQKLIDDALSNGASVVNENGGKAEASLVYPTVLYPVNEKMHIYREEQFGPVVPIVPFQQIAEPINYLVESRHGQQVSIFSSDKNELAALVDPLVKQVSRVNINCQCQRGPDVLPFTGRKDSAEGTLSVHDALRAFSIRSLVAAKASESNKKLINSIIDTNSSNFLSTRYIF
jgi:glyceraldehyde-3-phosphate dehydrogenase (NADP+)